MLPPGERPFWEPIAERFQEEFPGSRVELIEGPQATDLRENMYTTALLARDSTFDLVYMDVIWTSKFAAAGWLRELGQALQPQDLDVFLPAALQAGYFRGRLYRLPVRTDVGVLYYRKDLLEHGGFEPPASFSDLDRAARALQNPPELWGFVWQGSQYEGLVCDYLEVLTGFGGYWVDPATLEVGLDRPEAIRALEWMAATRTGDPISPPGVTTYKEEESRRLFLDGRAVFLRNWPYVWRTVQADDSPIRGKVGVVPMVTTEEGRSAGTLGGWGLGISSYSRRPDLAFRFMLFVTRPDMQRLLCAATGFAPARRDAYEDPELLAANPFLSRLLAVHDAAVSRPTIARYALASDILQRKLSAALAGREPAQAALRAAARETRAMLGRDAEAAERRAAAEPAR